jgi:uncharacterized protein YacL
MKDQDENKKDSLPERLKVIGGLIAVGVGVIAVAVIAGMAISKNSEIAATIASSTGGFIATIVGAYFGLKIGSDQTKSAHDSQKEEAAKAQVYAAHLRPEEAEKILDKAQQAADKAVAS